MTSEVAVMNRLAVALAADSAVSVSAGRHSKIYNSANKLFMLSNTHPVGIMVYSNGSLMGVPWEVLIKTFRRELGMTEHLRLEDYGKAFMDYLGSQTGLFDAALERSSFLKLVQTEFDDLARKIQREVQAEETTHGDEDDWKEQREKIVSELVRNCHDEWKNRDPHDVIPAGSGAQMRSESSGGIADLVTRYFTNRAWTVSSKDAQLLFDLAEFYVEKRYIAPSSYTGIVVAGFGRDDFFPVLQRFGVGDFYKGHLKSIELDTVRISEETPVHVGAYADSDMAGLFLKGVSTPALDFIIEHVFESGFLIGDAALEESGVTVTPEMEDRVAERRDEILKTLVSRLQHFRLSAGEFETALTHIPKDELASVAASLVNLNSFKKRISMSVESVGGPVDVAVISKGDGFIWIDRKHYFDADRNPNFMRRQGLPTDSQEK